MTLRTVQILVDKKLTELDVKKVMVLCYLAACVTFVWLASTSPVDTQALSASFVSIAAVGYGYTGLGLKYIALGDVIALVIPGPVFMFFAYIAQGGEHYAMPIVTAFH